MVQSQNPQGLEFPIPEEYGVLLEGHFILHAGYHSNYYIDKKNLYMYPSALSDVCWELAMDIAQNDSIPQVEVVVAPAIGGIMVAQWLACYLEELYQKTVMAIYTEKTQINYQFLRGRYKNVVAGKTILVADDILTNVETLRRVIQCVSNAGGNVVVGAVLFNRSIDGISSFDGIPVYSLYSLPLEDWSSKTCPVCAVGDKQPIRVF